MLCGKRRIAHFLAGAHLHTDNAHILRHLQHTFRTVARDKNALRSLFYRQKCLVVARLKADGTRVKPQLQGPNLLLRIVIHLHVPQALARRHHLYITRSQLSLTTRRVTMG